MARPRPGTLVLLLAAAAGCSTTERAFGGALGGGDPGATSGATTTAPSSSSTGEGGGGGGGGGDAAPASSSSGTGGAGCGDGVIGPDEECDEATSLCTGCLVQCPAGWFEASGSCFMVLQGAGALTQALYAAAQCGALDLSATGHRARLAIPDTQAQLEELATRCAGSGCWLGFYDLGDPTVPVEMVAPATGEALGDGVPWGAGEPSAALRHVCLRLRGVASGGATTPALSVDDCAGDVASIACELAPGWGAITTCGDGIVDPGEECDGGEDCVDCDRRCPEAWLEDPAAHQCLRETGTTASWDGSTLACSSTFGGSARLATPDDPADVRIAQFASAGPAWIGLINEGEPTWQSGEVFDYVGGQYPLPGDPAAGQHGSLVGGMVVLAPLDPLDQRRSLCELHDPG